MLSSENSSAGFIAFVLAFSACEPKYHLPWAMARQKDKPYRMVYVTDMMVMLLTQISFACWLQRNYRFYYMFVFSATLLCLYIHGFCWVYIRRIMDSEEISIWRAMIKTPASVALIIYSFICVWFVGGLTVFHTYLISTNQV